LSASHPLSVSSHPVHPILLEMSVSHVTCTNVLYHSGLILEFYFHSKIEPQYRE
jgi:hypothetical protein